MVSKLKFTSRSLNQVKGVLKSFRKNVLGSQRMFYDGKAQISITENNQTSKNPLQESSEENSFFCFLFFGINTYLYCLQYSMQFPLKLWCGFRRQENDQISCKPKQSWTSERDCEYFSFSTRELLFLSSLMSLGRTFCKLWVHPAVSDFGSSSDGNLIALLC